MFPPFIDFIYKYGYQQTKSSSSMKLTINYQVKDIPTKVTYYQEEVQNYPSWRHSKEELGFQLYPQDYKSDVTESLHDNKINGGTIISYNDIPIFIISFYIDDYEKYTLSLTCKIMNKLFK